MESEQVQTELANVGAAFANFETALAGTFSSGRLEIRVVLGESGAATGGENAADSVTVGTLAVGGTSPGSTLARGIASSVLG